MRATPREAVGPQRATPTSLLWTLERVRCGAAGSPWSNLSQRSSDHEVHLRTTDLRLVRTSKRNAERPDDECLREIFEIRR